MAWQLASAASARSTGLGPSSPPPSRLGSSIAIPCFRMVVSQRNASGQSLAAVRVTAARAGSASIRAMYSARAASLAVAVMDQASWVVGAGLIPSVPGARRSTLRPVTTTTRVLPGAPPLAPETRFVQLHDELRPLRLESGRTLAPVQVAYETW